MSFGITPVAGLDSLYETLTALSERSESLMQVPDAVATLVAARLVRRSDVTETQYNYEGEVVEVMRGIISLGESARKALDEYRYRRAVADAEKKQNET